MNTKAIIKTNDNQSFLFNGLELPAVYKISPHTCLDNVKIHNVFDSTDILYHGPIGNIKVDGVVVENRIQLFSLLRKILFSGFQPLQEVMDYYDGSSSGYEGGGIGMENFINWNTELFKIADPSPSTPMSIRNSSNSVVSLIEATNLLLSKTDGVVTAETTITLANGDPITQAEGDIKIVIYSNKGQLQSYYASPRAFCEKVVNTDGSMKLQWQMDDILGINDTQELSELAVKIIADTASPNIAFINQLACNGVLQFTKNQ